MPLCIAIDFETSGYALDSACAVGLVRVILPEDGSGADSPGRIDGTLYSLIRPPSPAVRFTHIHGLTWPMLRDAPRFADFWPEMATFINGSVAGGDSRPPDFFIAHNASFDRGVLRACCAKAGLPIPATPFLCTLKGARRALRLPSHRLDAVCAHCGIALNHHHAESDARAAAAIFLHLRSRGLAFDAMRIG